jgi:hypothetical protein
LYGYFRAANGPKNSCYKDINGLFDTDQELAQKIKTELQPWFGKQVEDWSHIKTYKVKYALPQLAVLKDDLTIAD